MTPEDKEKQPLKLELIKEYKFKDEAENEWFYRTKYKVKNQ